MCFRKYFVLFLTLSALASVQPRAASAQNIPNPSFDSLCVCAIDRVFDWTTSDLYNQWQDTILAHTPNTVFPPFTVMNNMAMFTVKINYNFTDTIHGFNSVVIDNIPNLVYPDGSKFLSFLTNGNTFTTDSAGFIDFAAGGTAFPYRPTHIIGNYQYIDTVAAFPGNGRMQLLLKKYNSATGVSDTVGYADGVAQFISTNGWTAFQVPIIYQSAATPDSVVVVFMTGSPMNTPSHFHIDDIDFLFPTYTPTNDIKCCEVLYPNPAAGIINVQGLKNPAFRYELHNALGVRVSKGKWAGSLDIHHLRAGVYILSLYNGQELIRNFQFVKQ